MRIPLALENAIISLENHQPQNRKVARFILILTGKADDELGFK